MVCPCLICPPVYRIPGAGSSGGPARPRLTARPFRQLGDRAGVRSRGAPFPHYWIGRSRGIVRLSPRPPQCPRLRPGPCRVALRAWLRSVAPALPGMRHRGGPSAGHPRQRAEGAPQAVAQRRRHPAEDPRSLRRELPAEAVPTPWKHAVARRDRRPRFSSGPTPPGDRDRTPPRAAYFAARRSDSMPYWAGSSCSKAFMPLTRLASQAIRFSLGVA